MAKKKPKPERPRTEQRALARDVQKLAEMREKLADLSAGGSSKHPILVQSASQIEVQARALTCPRCEHQGLRIDEHRAESGTRVLSTRCPNCGNERDYYYAIAALN